MGDESVMPEYFETGSKKPGRGKGRGMAPASLDLIAAMREIAEPLQPITGRGIGYQLFTRKLIASMERSEMARVYRLLKEARERGIIPWSWIVDETRPIERVSTWDDPADYAHCVARSYRRDFWNQQPHRVHVMSEKGTVRGVLAPVLDELAVAFRSAASQAPQRSTTSPRTTTGGRSSFSTSATMTRVGCSCRSATYPSGSPDTMATTSG